MLQCLPGIAVLYLSKNSDELVRAQKKNPPRKKNQNHSKGYWFSVCHTVCKTIGALVQCAIILLLITQSGLANADNNAKWQAVYDINLPRQNVAKSLSDLSEQADQMMLFSYEEVEPFSANPIVGRYTLQQALEIMLQGTGLSGSLTTKGVLMVSQKKFSEAKKQTEGIDKMNAKKNLLTATVAFFSGVGGAQVGLAQESAAAEKSGWVLEEIVVTAQKRGEQDLQSVPISMSVLGGDALDTMRIQGVLEGLNDVPGVTLYEGSLNNASKISIRGVSASGTIFSGAGTVSYYIDEVPFGRPGSAFVPDISGYDMERIEVLRGPQGTLYGASAFNGVVRVLTKDANLDEMKFKARASLSDTQDGGENYRVDTALSVPLIPGKLAVRGVLGYNDTSGWIDQPNRAEGSTKDVNDGELENYRFKVNALPTEELSIELGLTSSRSDFGGPSIADDNGEDPVATLPQPIATDFDSYGLVIEYEFSKFTLTSATSYVDYTSESHFDFSTDLLSRFESDSLTQEIRLASSLDGPWQWSGGGFYQDAEALNYQEADFSGFLFVVDFEDVYESFAFFGEVTRSFADGAFDLTAGLRYYEEERERNNAVTMFGSVEEDDTVTPRIVLTWYPEDDLTVYASYSEGFRSGGNKDSLVATVDPNFPATEPDTLINYEIGAKGELMDGKLRFDSALYYMDWQDVQQNLLVEVNTVEVTTGVNAGSASGVGVDFGVTVLPVESLTLGFNVSWNDLTIDENVLRADGVAFFEKGDRLTDSAKYTLGFNADYRFPIGSNGYAGRLSGSVSHKTPLESRTGLGVATESDEITMARLSLAVDAPENWTGSLFVDNLMNEDGTVKPDANGVTRWNSRVRPRTVGVQVEYQY